MFMRKVLLFLFLLLVSIGPANAALYEFSGTFGPDAIPDTFEGDLFGSLENQLFSGEFDDTAEYFTFQTTGYSYEATDITSWNDYSSMIIIFMNDGNFFDVRDTDGEPNTLWIKKGDAMIGGVVNASSVPVPAAVWLLGSGLIGLAGLRKRMKS